MKYQTGFLRPAAAVTRSGRDLLIAVQTFLILILVAGSSLQVANAANSGQDPTQPVTRFDIRFENDELPYDNNFDNNNDSDTIIFRVDAPIPLGHKGSGGVLAFRFDVPLTSTRTNVPGESGDFGFGSVYMQFLHIVPKSWGNLPGGAAWAWGYAAQLATATNGRQDRTDILVFGSKWNWNKTGSNFIVPVLKYYNGDADTANSFDAIDELHLQLTMNFDIPAGIDFITLWGNYDMVFNFEDGIYNGHQSGDYFIPWDVTVGKLLSKGKVVLSATLAGPLAYSTNFKQFDERFLLRAGFFF